MTRKEMIPPPVRDVHKSMAFCKPEWDLLCRIRKGIGDVTARHTKSEILMILTTVIHYMNQTFDDWPEDPK